MAKLVLGNTKTKITPAIVRDVAPAHYIEKTVNGNGKLVNTANFINLNGATDVEAHVLQGQYFNVEFPANTSIDLSSLTTISGSYACGYMFGSCGNLTSVDLSSLTTVSGMNACDNMFVNCYYLTSVDLSSLTTISGTNGCASMFYSSGLSSVDLSSLTTISGSYGCSQMFNGCTNLTSIDLSSLTTITGNAACGNMFASCTSLTTVDFSSLTTITTSESCAYMFSRSSSLVNVSFPSLTTNSFGTRYINQLNGMLNYVTGCTVHFPSNTQAKIETMTGYPNFGGTNTTVLFDLPATNTLTGADTVTYTRNPKYDTQTALAWKVGAYGTTNFTPACYTNGIIDPVVGATIYSDAACTTAVTTISSIA